MAARRHDSDKSNVQSLRLRSMYGCPDLGTTVWKVLKQFGKTQTDLAPMLGVSPGQVSKIFSDKKDMTVGQLLHLAHVAKERPSAFLREKNAPDVELVQALRQLIEIASPMVGWSGLPAGAEETRQIALLRVAATPDNVTYDDDPEPRMFPLPPEYDKPGTGAFEVIGDSMSGDAIVSGDVILTRPVRTLQECDGEIVVCSVHGDRHLKRLRYRRGKVGLESSAPEPRIWELNPSERRSLQVVGRVVQQMRRVAR